MVWAYPSGLIEVVTIQTRGTIARRTQIQRATWRAPSGCVDRLYVSPQASTRSELRARMRSICGTRMERKTRNAIPSDAAAPTLKSCKRGAVDRQIDDLGRDTGSASVSTGSCRTS